MKGRAKTEKRRRGVSGAILVSTIYAAGCATGPRTIAVTSNAEAGPGSLREAISEANRAEDEVRIAAAAGGLEILITRELPPLAGDRVIFDGHGITLRSGECVREDGRRGCSGLVVTGDRISVLGVEVAGFLFDGISVRGPRASGVRIERAHLHGNRDDGVGVSERASAVTVSDCLIERNGFRTKGKGVLVFDDSHARLLGNVIRGNRDGVTVSRRASAELVRNRIVDNFDKGLGVAGAIASGVGNEIRGNGAGPGPDGSDPPNADGLRVTLDSVVELDATRITGNGDTGVVAIGSSRVSLVGGEIRDNGGAAVSAGDEAQVRIRGVSWGGETPEIAVTGNAAVRGAVSSGERR